MEQKVRSSKMFLTRGERSDGDLEGKGMSGERESGLERGGSDRLFRLVWFISGVLFFQCFSLSLSVNSSRLCVCRKVEGETVSVTVNGFSFTGRVIPRFGLAAIVGPAS